MGVEMRSPKCNETRTLADNQEGSISICGCGLYHVRVNTTTLHLTAPQFEGAARLFKVVLGMLCAKETEAPQIESGEFFPAKWISRKESISNRMVCLHCGESFEVVFDQTECLKNDIANAYGFEMVQHKMQIYGYCQWCRSTPS